MTATNRRSAPPAGTPAWLDYCAAKYRSSIPIPVSICRIRAASSPVAERGRSMARRRRRANMAPAAVHAGASLARRADAEPPYTPTVRGLPTTVPFVGPEAQERQRGQAVSGPYRGERVAFRAFAAGRRGDGNGRSRSMEILRSRKPRPEAGACQPPRRETGKCSDRRGHRRTAGLHGENVRRARTRWSTSLGAYPTFNFHVAGHGGRLLTAPYRNDREDLEALLGAGTPAGARLLYLANPDNPMGSWWDASEIQRLIDALPDNIVLCLDEAYLEFAPQGTAPPIDVATRRCCVSGRFPRPTVLPGRDRVCPGRSWADRKFQSGKKSFRREPHRPGRRLGRAFRSGPPLARVIAGHRAARQRIARIAVERGPRPAAVGHQFRDHRLRRRRRLRTPACWRELASARCSSACPACEPLDRCIRVSVGLRPELDIFAAALPERACRRASLVSSCNTCRIRPDAACARSG